MRRSLIAAATFGVLGLVAGCAEKPDSSIRPLVDLEGIDLSVANYDDASLQARLEKLVDDTAQTAAEAGGWGNLTTDLLNPVVGDVVFVGEDRPTLAFGYGDEATSMQAKDERVVFTMAGDTGSCWGVRVSGDINDPDVAYGVLFAPNCTAATLEDLDDGGWQETWPPTAEPPADASVTAGQPPAP